MMKFAHPTWTRWLSMSCLAFLCTACGMLGSGGPKLDHSIRLDDQSELLVTADFHRESATFIRYSPVRFTIAGKKDSPEIEGLELVLFDDTNGDGRFQDGELCGRVHANLGVPTNRVEISGLRATQPRLRPSWWVRVRTTQDTATEVWQQDPSAGPGE